MCDGSGAKPKWTPHDCAIHGVCGACDGLVRVNQVGTLVSHEPRSKK